MTQWINYDVKLYVLMVSPEYPPIAGGVGRYTANLIRMPIRDFAGLLFMHNLETRVDSHMLSGQQRRYIQENR